MKVFVYFNLHKRVFSVKALEGPNKGRVIKRTGDMFLTNVEFRVSKAGRARVLREKKKNVHAGVVGYMTDAMFYCPIDVTYNPYKYESFVQREDESPIHKAGAVHLTLKETPNGRFGNIQAAH